jgi:hypothetical protein
MGATPTTLRDYIETIREAFVCARCGRYVGSLAASEYVPPPYPVAVEDVPEDDEVRSLVTFEWHMLGLLRQGRFTLTHPQKGGVCVSAAEWARDGDEDEGEDEPDGA